MRNQIYLFIVLLFVGSKTFAQNTLTLFQGNLTNVSPMVVNGNDLYVGLYYQNKIVKMDITNPSTPAVDVITGLNRPYGLEIKDNKLYVSETNANKISRFDLTNLALPSVTIASNLGAPMGLEFIGNDLYVAREGSFKISKIDITQATFPVTDVVQADRPFEIEAIDNNLFISERFLGIVSKVDLNNLSAGKTTVVQGLTSPSGLESIGKTLYITEAEAKKVVKVNTDAATPVAVDAIVSSQLQYPSRLLIHNNALYISDFFASSVFKSDLSNLSVSDVKTKEVEIKLYPNPAHDRLYILNSNSQKYRIFDMSGRLVSSGNIDKNNINISHLTEGNYIFETEGATQQFIKK